jgi:hypothetical protein
MCAHLTSCRHTGGLAEDGQDDFAGRAGRVGGPRGVNPRASSLLMALSRCASRESLVILGDMIRRGCWLTCGCLHDIG